MKGDSRGSLGRVVVAATVGAIAAACSTQPAVPGEGATIAPMERPAWNAPTESGLFRITFDARRAAEIRREAASSQAQEGLDAYTSEMRLIDREAEKELRARGLCSGSAKLVTYIDPGDGRSGFSAIFKCRLPIF